MTDTADRTDPKLWDKIKDKVQSGSKGGKPGQWSARKAQLAVHDYKAAGGGYKGEKSPDNHLAQWTKEEWGTKSGEKSGETGERYLPKQARAKLSAKDTTAPHPRSAPTPSAASSSLPSRKMSPTRRRPPASRRCRSPNSASKRRHAR